MNNALTNCGIQDDETAGDGDSSQDIVPFRTDLGEEFGEVSVGIAQPLIKLESTVDDNDSILAQKDFHKELRKAEIFVDIQEKFIKKHLELKRLNQSTDMPKFIQGLVAEHMEELFP